MSAAACEVGAIAATDDAKPTPFSRQWVRLSKQEHIELLMQGRSWKSLHERAVRRNLWLQCPLRRQHEQAEQRELPLRDQLDLAQANPRSATAPVVRLAAQLLAQGPLVQRRE